MPSALAIFAHPDDIEFVAAGTLLMLKQQGWDIHYMNLSRGGCGSVDMNVETLELKRLAEAQDAAGILGARFHEPIAADMEILYSVEALRKVAAVVREAAPSIVLTHSPHDYMEDHMNTSRLAVSAAFSRGMPNFVTDPERPHVRGDVTVYHAMPHGMRDGLRRRVHAGAFVNTTKVHAVKRQALAAHKSQKDWLDLSQGMDSYLVSMDEASLELGRTSGYFQHAEGWRRHSHLGFSTADVDDPLKEALGPDCIICVDYEKWLDT